MPAALYASERPVPSLTGRGLRARETGAGGALYASERPVPSHTGRGIRARETGEGQPECYGPRMQRRELLRVSNLCAGRTNTCRQEIYEKALSIRPPYCLYATSFGRIVYFRNPDFRFVYDSCAFAFVIRILKSIPIASDYINSVCNMRILTIGIYRLSWIGRGRENKPWIGRENKPFSSSIYTHCVTQTQRFRLHQQCMQLSNDLIYSVLPPTFFSLISLS